MVKTYVSQHNFSIVPDVKKPRSTFSRPHSNSFTCNADYLIPFYWEEVLPGDTINLTHSIFARLMSPMNVPLMDNLWLETFYFFVPERLLWTHWEEFNGENKNPVSNPVPPVYTMPQIYGSCTVSNNVKTTGVTTISSNNVFDVGSLADYLKMPVGIPGISMRASWHRAYNKIYNDWFKDENLIDNAPEYDDDTNRTDYYYPIRKRGKRFDYFTACLPTPQKGPAVELPLGTSAPVYGTGAPLLLTDGSSTNALGNMWYTTTNTANKLSATSTLVSTLPSTGTSSQTVPSSWSNYDRIGVPTKTQAGTNNTGLLADLSSATAATINSLYEAFAYQKLFYTDNIGGTRYTEILRAHFGVVSPDGRLQRPEFLGSDSTMMSMTNIAQTSESTSNNKLGELASFGYFNTIKHGFIRSFSEHGVILGLLNIRADLRYQQGIPRAFSRKERFDFYYPALANIGEQAVLNKEIFAQGTSADEQVFGYIGRWDEYRYKESYISGLLRSDFGNLPGYQTLDFWHLTQEFANLPTLNQTFIEPDTPVSRIVAITNLPQFIVDCHFKQAHTRVMPMYNQPGKGIL